MVGLGVGDSLGCPLGVVDGLRELADVGFVDGDTDGLREGEVDRDCEGREVGFKVGAVNRKTSEPFSLRRYISSTSSTANCKRP